VELLKRLEAAGHEVEVFTSSPRRARSGYSPGSRASFRYFRAVGEPDHEEAAPDRMKRSLL